MQVTKSEKFVKGEEIAKFKGVVFKILDEPRLSEGQFGPKIECRILLVHEKDQYPAKWSMNDHCRDTMIDLFGTETTKWMGKEIKIHAELVNGKESIRLN